jgi:hypothetical protein
MNTKTETKRPLTDREVAALTEFAREHGPRWKYALETLWYRAAAQPTLHCLRNSHGPAWLESFQMEQPARIAPGVTATVVRGSRAIGLLKGARVRVERVESRMEPHYGPGGHPGPTTYVTIAYGGARVGVFGEVEKTFRVAPGSSLGDLSTVLIEAKPLRSAGDARIEVETSYYAPRE